MQISTSYRHITYVLCSDPCSITITSGTPSATASCVPRSLCPSSQEHRSNVKLHQELHSCFSITQASTPFARLLAVGDTYCVGHAYDTSRMSVRKAFAGVFSCLGMVAPVYSHITFSQDQQTNHYHACMQYEFCESPRDYNAGSSNGNFILRKKSFSSLCYACYFTHIINGAE